MEEGIILAAYKVIVREYTKRKQFKELYIDASNIRNLNCSTYVDYYYKIKSKKQMKVGIISNNDDIVISYHICNSPKIHDSKIVKPLVKNLDNNIIKKGAVVAGDKGFIKKQLTFTRKNKRIKLVTPKRKNQKPYKKQPKIIKKRTKVEHALCKLFKTYKRLREIKDRKIKNFDAFIKMAIMGSMISRLI